MGKKRVSVLGSEEEQELKAKKAVKLEQKKLREGKSVTAKPSTSTPPETATPESEAAVEPVFTPASVSEEKETAKPGRRVHQHSKAYLSMKSKVSSEQVFSLPEGLSLLRQVTLGKFDGTVELHLTVKTKGLTKQVELPFSTGKVRRIAVADEATLSKIEAGQIDFDVLVASPAQMGKLVKFAKVLGPKGLMPNPKTGTVSENPEETAKKLTGSQTLYIKTEKDQPLIHTVAGKMSQKDDQLLANIQTILGSLPASEIRKVTLKSTMSPAIKIQA